MNLQLNTFVHLGASLPGIAFRPDSPRNLSKSYLISLVLLVLGVLLLMVGVAGAIFLPATGCFLSAGFLVPTGIILGSVSIFFAIQDFVHKMYEWRKTCLSFKNQLCTQNDTLQKTTKLNGRKLLFSTPLDIIGSTYGISRRKIWSSIIRIIVGVGMLLGSFCLGCLLPNFTSTIVSTCLGVLGGGLLVSGVKSYQNFILNCYGIIYLSALLREKSSALAIQQENLHCNQDLTHKVTKLEEQINNMINEQADLILSYEQKLNKVLQNEQYSSHSKQTKQGFWQQKAQFISNGISTVRNACTLDMFWAGDDDD